MCGNQTLGRFSIAPRQQFVLPLAALVPVEVVLVSVVLEAVLSVALVPVEVVLVFVALVPVEALSSLSEVVIQVD
jgi:hypothetical protein